jgi:hypothetical protein
MQNGTDAGEVVECYRRGCDRDAIAFFDTEEYTLGVCSRDIPGVELRGRKVYDKPSYLGWRCYLRGCGNDAIAFFASDTGTHGVCRHDRDEVVRSLGVALHATPEAVGSIPANGT